MIWKALATPPTNTNGWFLDSLAAGFGAVFTPALSYCYAALGIGAGIAYYYLAAFTFGAAVGAGEIVSRYKTDPGRAIRTTTGLAYVAVNALASVGALYIVRRMEWLTIADEVDQTLLSQTIAASFGAVAIFRSSLFTLRVGDKDVAIGPMGMLQALLNAADRATDRACARPRAEAITRIMAGISFQSAKEALPTLCFSLMQNVSLEEQQSVRGDVDRLVNSQMQDADKANNLGLTLLSVVGEEVLARAVDILRRSIRLVQAPPSVTLIQLTRKLTFQAHAKDLVELLSLSTGQNTAWRASIDAQAARIGNLNISDGDKLFMLVALLLAEFGESPIERALAALDAAQP